MNTRTNAYAVWLSFLCRFTINTLATTTTATIIIDRVFEWCLFSFLDCTMHKNWAKRHNKYISIAERLRAHRNHLSGISCAIVIVININILSLLGGCKWVSACRCECVCESLHFFSSVFFRDYSRFESPNSFFLPAFGVVCKKISCKFVCCVNERANEQTEWRTKYKNK